MTSGAGQQPPPEPAADGAAVDGKPRIIGIAIGLPSAVEGEVQQVRAELGDPQADLIIPHVTLLPPTAIPPDELEAVEEHLREVARSFRPFGVRLQGTGTFRPISDVVFVPLVEGEDECSQLEGKVRQGPLARDLRFPYHPHVTLAHDVGDEAVDAGLEMLADYDAEFTAWGFTLFEQYDDGEWRPQRDFPFATGAPGPQPSS